MLFFNPNYALGKQNSVQSFVKSFEFFVVKKEITTKVKEGSHKENQFLMRNQGLNFTKMKKN